MFEGEKKIDLSDLIDIQLLQKFQDAFAKAMNVASITVDSNGPITKPSNFTDFCIKYTRGSSKGLEKCNACDIKWGQLAASKNEPVIYPCHTGLTDFAVPIVVEGVHIASILGGQVLTKAPDEAKFREVAKELGINEEDYIDALRKIKIVPEQNVKAAAQLLFIVAKAISTLAQKNFKLIENSKRETLLRKINEAIRSTLDINEAKKIIVNLIGKTFNADRCFIAEYDNLHDKFFLIKDEYRSSKDITPYAGSDPNKDVPHFVTALRNGQTLVINDKKIFLDGVRKNYDKEKIAIEKFNVNAVFSAPLFYDTEFLGVFAIHYVKEHHIDEDEIKLASLIANQIAIALHQAKLYDTLKQTTASQNAILNNMPFMAWLKDAKSRLLSVNNEFAKMCNTSVENIIGKTDFDFFPKDLAETYVKEDRIAMETKQTISSVDLIAGPQGPRWHETFKSPVINYKGNVVGTVGISSDITEKKEADLELLNRQEKIIKASEREKLYRNITEAIRSTLDINETKKKIVDLVGKNLSADRCFIVEYDETSDKFLPVIDEYLSSDKIKPYKGTDVNKDVPNFMEALKDGKNVIVNNKEICVDMDNVDFFPEKEAITNNQVISAMGFPLCHKGELLGVLAIHYVDQQHEVGDDEINLMEAITSQIAIALKQAQIYEQEKETAQRESLLRKIVETLRSTLNVEDVKKYFVDMIGNYFDADRCLFIEYDRATMKMLPVNIEKLKSPNIKSLMGLDPDSSLPEFCAKIKEGKSLIVRDLEKLLSNEKISQYASVKALKSLGVKSDYALVVKYKDQILGALVIHFVDKKRNLTHEEFDFLKILNYQTGIAIYQTELYEIKKQQAEREVLLRNITEAIRSNLDINKTKKTIVDIIGKTLKADRCYITEYDKRTDKFLIIEYEYLSSDDIVGYKGIDVNVKLPNFAAAVKQGQKLLINNKEIALDYGDKDFTPEKEMIKKYKINSSFVFPLYYRDELLGALSIHYVKEKRSISDEIDLFNILANQVAVAIYQANLYKLTQMQAEREVILREITQIIRSSIDIDFVKKEMVLQIGKFLNADRVAFADYDYRKENYFILPGNEYKSSKKVKTFVGYDFAATPGFIDAIRALHLSGKDIIFSDLDKYIIDNNLQDTGIENFYKEMGFGSSLAININHGDNFYGNLVVTFEEKRDITEDDIKMIKTIADQAGIAIYQSTLYKQEKQAAEREALLRSITEKIRSTLDIDQLFELICRELVNVFDVQRAFIVRYNTDTNEFTIKKEFKTAESVQGLGDVEFDARTIDYWGNTLLREGKKIVIDNIAESDTPDYFKETYKNIGEKATIGIAIQKDEDRWGWVGIAEYNNYRHWSEEEKELLATIADQIYIAFNQAELFEKEKKTAEREILIREIVSKVSSTLDINEIIHTFVFELGKILSAQKVFFSKYDELTNTLLTPDENAEYLESLNTLRYKDMSTILDDNFPVFCEQIKSSKDMMLIPDVEKFFEEKGLKDNINFESTRKYNFNSAIAFPIVSQGKLLGFYGIEYEKATNLSQPIIDLLTTIAKQTSIAMKQAYLYQNEKTAAEREALLRSITEKIRSTLDIDKILDFICTEAIKIFNVERAVIVEFPDQHNYYNDIIRKECKTREDIKNIADVTSDKRVTGVWGRHLLLDKKLFAFDNLSTLDAPDYFKEPYNKIGLKSAIGATIEKENEKWGVIILFEYDNYRQWTDDEINLLETIAGQLYIALQQAELYNETLMNAQRESLLAKITSTAISTFDLSKIKQIVVEIGILTKADRCYYVEVDLENMKGKPIAYDREYLASSDIKSVIGYDFPTDEVEQFISLFLEAQDLSVFDYESILENKNEKYAGIRKYIQRFKMKSGVGIPFFYMDKLVAVLAIEYSKEKVLPSNEELDFLRILGNQIGMAFNQIQLYQQTKITAERESLLRKIFEIMRSSLELNVIKSKIVEEIGKVLNGDRCYILTYEPFNDYFFVDENSEYRATEDEQSFIGTNSKDLNAAWFTDAFKHNQETNFADVETFIAANNLQGTPDEEILHKFNIKSGYHIPILYGKRLLGYIILNYTSRYKLLDEGDLEFLKIIATQAGIAFHQAKLYNLTKFQADRERLYRTITETIRSSLDIDKTKKTIVEKVGKTLNVDRCFIMDYDQNEDRFLPISDEYLSSNDISSYIGMDVNADVPHLLEEIKKGQIVFIENKEKFLTETNPELDLDKIGIEKYELASAYGFPIFYYNELLGILGIHYVKQVHKVTEEETNLIMIIVNQIAIALHQAQLFKMTKIQAEREKISRSIIEILRSSLDKNMIKSLFVKNIGKYFAADRVFFSEYDPQEVMYLPVDMYSEYLSTPEEKSFVGFDWSDDSVVEFIQPLIERKEIKIPNLDQYIKENHKSQEIIDLFQSSNVKSSYNMPVMYQQRIMGYFSIEFTHKFYKFTEDDINLIRSICRQAGIALYQAELYLDSQASVRAKDEFIRNMTQEVKAQLSGITEVTTNLSNAENECDRQNEYINNLNESVKKLLGLMDDINY